MLGRETATDVGFFEAGGTSLKALRLATLLQEAFDQTVAVADLYERPTIETQARWLSPGGEPERSAERPRERRVIQKRRRR